MALTGRRLITIPRDTGGLYETNPLAIHGTGMVGTAMNKQSGSLSTISFGNSSLRGRMSIGSFINYWMSFDIGPLTPDNIIDPVNVTLSDILNYTFYFKYMESLLDPIGDSYFIDASPPPNGQPLVNSQWHHFFFATPSTLSELNSLNAYVPLDLSNNPAPFTPALMSENISRYQRIPDVYGKCYIAFQERTYAPPEPWTGTYVRVFIFREAMLFRDHRVSMTTDSETFTTDYTNWQIDDFLAPNNKDQLDLNIVNPNRRVHFTSDETYIAGYIRACPNLTPQLQVSDWLYGGSLAKAHYDSVETSPNNYDYRVSFDASDTDKIFYLNVDRADNLHLFPKEVVEYAPPKLERVSDNVEISSLSLTERMRFTATLEFPQASNTYYPNGILNIGPPPNDTRFFESIHGFIIKTKVNPANNMGQVDRSTLWGRAENIIIDAFKVTEETELPFNYIENGSFGDNLNRIPYYTFPDWFVQSRASGSSDLFYGPLVLSDLAPPNVGSNKIQISFELDFFGKLVPNGPLAVGEEYRIILVFGLKNGPNDDPITALPYGDALPNSTYSYISPAYGLSVISEEPRESCPPDVCSYIEDYIKSYPDNLEVSPLDRLRSTVTFFSKKFDQCRTYPEPINVQHHFESGVRQVRYRIYWDEYDSNNVPIFRHVVQSGAKTPNFNNPSLPYTGSPELIETVQVFDPNTETYGFLSLSVEYRIRDEANIANIVTIQLDANGNELSQTVNPTQNQDWTNKTLYVEFAVDVQFTLLNAILSDTFVKRQILRVIDFDSNKLEANRILKLELTSDDNGANAVVINDLLTTQSIAFVRASQVLNDDNNLINPLDPVQDDYHISLIRKAPFGSATTFEFEEIPANQLQQLQSLPLISSEANFSTAPVPLAFGGFDVQALDPNADYQYAAIKKKHTKDLDDCTDSVSASGNPGVYYYPVNLGVINSAKKYIVCVYNMLAFPDGLRFVHNNKVAFYTQSYDPYTQGIVAAADFDLSGMSADWTILIEGLQDDTSCLSIDPNFEYTFNNYQSILDQIGIFVDQINSCPNALAGKLRAYRNDPSAFTITIVWFDVLDTCCGASISYRKIDPLALFNTPISTLVNCCGPNASLNPNDGYVVPDLVGSDADFIYSSQLPLVPANAGVDLANIYRRYGAFGYELSETVGSNCFNAGELLIVSPICHRGVSGPSLWQVSLHCPMELIPYTANAFVITNTDARFTGVVNGLYGFLYESMDSTNAFSFDISASSGTGWIRVYMLDDDGLGFNQPLHILQLGFTATVNVPARTNFNKMPHVIIAVQASAAWSITIN